MVDSKLQSTILVIVGITGNLAQQRLLPALYHLIKDHLLPEDTEIVGTSRRDISVDELLKNVELCVLEADKVCDPQALAEFRRKLRMVRFDPAQATDYNDLLKTLQDIETDHGQCMNRLFSF